MSRVTLSLSTGICPTDVALELPVLKITSCTACVRLLLVGKKTLYCFYNFLKLFQYPGGK